MARVYLEYTKNTLLEYPDYFMIALFLGTSLALVSVRSILTNVPKDNLVHTFNFFVIALRNTSWIIQTLVVGFFVRILVSGLMLAYKNKNVSWIMTKFKY